VPDGALSKDIERILEALRAEYLAELPVMIKTLAELVGEAAVQEAAVPLARRAAHQLRGTAGSYGFPEVGEAAGRIEDALEAGAGVPAELVEALATLGDQAGLMGGSSGSSK
jgi:HPt (histidine-containing phosphotransfer) domain-containing protein